MLGCAEPGWPWKAAWWLEPDAASRRGASGSSCRGIAGPRGETHPSSDLPLLGKLNTV